MNETSFNMTRYWNKRFFSFVGINIFRCAIHFFSKTMVIKSFFFIPPTNSCKIALAPKKFFFPNFSCYCFVKPVANYSCQVLFTISDQTCYVIGNHWMSIEHHNYNILSSKHHAVHVLMWYMLMFFCFFRLLLMCYLMITALTNSLVSYHVVLFLVTWAVFHNAIIVYDCCRSMTKYGGHNHLNTKIGLFAHEILLALYIMYIS